MRKILLLIMSIGALISCNSEEITESIETGSLMGSPSLKVQEGISIQNSGLVLLNPFLPKLFENLGLTSGNGFVNSDKKIDAVFYLQYLVDGSLDNEDSDLVLNKILCGIPVSETITSGIDLSNEEKIIIEELLQTIITQWTPLIGSSIDGLQGSFLQREGVLTETEDGWQLTVEKKAFDILLDQLPWSFTSIKYQWMGKRLTVEW